MVRIRRVLAARVLAGQRVLTRQGVLAARVLAAAMDMAAARVLAGVRVLAALSVVTVAGVMIWVSSSAWGAPVQTVRAAPGNLSSVTLHPVADAYVSEVAGTDNFGDRDKLDVQNLDSGEFPDDRRSYVGFDLSNIPSDAVVSNASFRAYMYDAQGLSKVDLELRRVTSPWTGEGVTWNKKPSSSEYDDELVDTQTGYVSWEVTSLVQDYWIGRGFGSSTNHGLELRGPESGDYYLRRFHSSEAQWYWPELIVEYTVSTTTPTATATLTPTETPQATATPTATPTDTPPGELPDLVITDVWYKNGSICYQIRNIGQGTAPKGHSSILSVDGQPVAGDQVNVELAPGERLNRCFNYDWQCTPLKDTIRVCADGQDFVAEGDETNNCTEETWKCDSTPPTITSGPTVSEITQTSAMVSWTTGEDGDSRIRYGEHAGQYEYQAGSATLSAAHQIALTDLKPSTTYQYYVESTDASGNTVTSAEAYFRTLASPGGAAPQVTYLGLMKRGLPPNFMAGMADYDDVDRVEFYIGGVPAETDYSAPFSFSLDPRFLGMSRAAYFAEHRIEARAYARNALVSVDATDFFPVPACDPPAEWFFRSPYEGYIISTSGSVAEPGSRLGISVDASTTEWEYGHVSGHPDIETVVGTPVDRMEFWVDGTRVYNSTAATTMHNYEWDASGASIGEHTVVVKAYFQEDCIYTESRIFRVVRPRPDLAVTRTVERVGNYFRVTVLVENTAEDISESAFIDGFVHNCMVMGLQTIDKTTASSSVVSRYLVATKSCETVLSVEPGQLVSPGGTLAIQYLAVPILYPGSAGYSIGEVTTVIDYRDAYGTTYHETFSLPAEEGAHFGSLVDDAIRESDYLIVTNPYNLLGLYDQDEANVVLDKMAELATLQNGVLGYFMGYSVLETGFEAGEQVAPAGGHIFGNADDEELTLADYSDDLIRVYNANEELFIETEGRLPITHTLDSGDLVVMGNVRDRDEASDPHDRAEILVADGDDGTVTVYSYNYRPGSGEFTIFEAASSYDPGDGFAVGNVELVGSNYWREEILVANTDGMVDIYHNLSSTPVVSLASVYSSGDGFAAGQVLVSDKERIIISHIDRDRIAIYNWNWSEPSLVQEYSISVSLAPEDALSVGDVWGDAKEEIVLADEDADTILIYGYDPVRDRFEQVAEFDYFFQAEDSLSVASMFNGGKDEILIVRGRSSGGHEEGNVEILSVAAGETPGDGYALDDLIGETDDWTERMCGDWASEGYLLLVGETEIVPTFSTGWDLTGSDRGSVDYTDRNYASTDDENNYPELSMGRIIGNSPGRLQTLLQASIDILRGDKEFDNSDAYAVSGSRRGPSGESDSIDFAANRDSVASSLRSAGFSVDEEHTPSETEFFSGATNVDVIFIGGHGGRTVWDIIDRDEVSGRFRPGRHRPLVYAASCLTGRYPPGRSIAEEFLNNGASGYIGATEVGIWPWGGRIGENYFSALDPGVSVGTALKNAKIHRLGVNTYAWDPAFNRYTCAIFHLYGDPKLAPWPLASEAEAQTLGPSPLMGPLSSTQVTIPDYEVTSVEDGDLVEIPGGGMVLVPGMPMVPSYNLVIEYPKGQMIQDVVLTEKGGLVTDTGLSIPLAIPAEAAATAGDVSTFSLAAEGPGWWPDADFAWTTIRNPDDSITLIITIFPFYYNGATTNVEFYKDYAFDITYTTSEVEITLLETDRFAYREGETVVASVYVLNSGQGPVDVIAEATVRSEATGETVSGFPLRTLTDVRGLASFTMDLDTTGLPSGNYLLEVAVRDAAGALLDSETETILLGTSSGRITAFSATPGYFELGDTIAMSLTFENSGTRDIGGSATIIVRDEVGQLVHEFAREISGLAAGNSVSFEDGWDTSVAQGEWYRIVGQVVYGGKATEPVAAVVKRVGTGYVVHLPAIMK